MHLRLHANATTTPRTRAYIQKSTASNEALARELGIHRRTVARWRTRHDVADRSTRPHCPASPITDWEEALIVERNANDPNRVDVLLPPDFVNHLRIFAALVQFRL